MSYIRPPAETIVPRMPLTGLAGIGEYRQRGDGEAVEMISISQKTQYALRGIFELARRGGRSATVSELAVAQAIPRRFLELIFGELRQAGLVKTFRGSQGGQVLAKPASEITLGEILRIVEGPTNLVRCVSGAEDCPFIKACPFRETWDEAAQAMDAVFDRTTIQALLERAMASPVGTNVRTAT